MQIISVNSIRDPFVNDIMLKPSQIKFDESHFAQPSYYIHFHCLFRILGFVSNSNGIESLWTVNRPQLLRQLNTWNHCSIIGLATNRYSYVTKKFILFLISHTQKKKYFY